MIYKILLILTTFNWFRYNYMVSIDKCPLELSPDILWSLKKRSFQGQTKLTTEDLEIKVIK